MDPRYSPMDRPRQRKGTPLGRAALSWLKTGLLLSAVITAVAVIPIFLLLRFQPVADISSARADSLIVSTANLPPRAEPVRFASGMLTLSGTFHLPAGPGPFPAVAVVHGSGRRTAADLFWMAEAWSQAGFAVLTWDKRGVGGSDGRYAAVGVANSERVLSDLADDAMAAARFLGRQRDVRHGAVGLVGVSQGGWIAPLAARRSRDVAFLVLYSGPAVSVGREIHYSDLTGDGGGGTFLTDAEIRTALAAYDGPDGFDPVPVLEGLDTPGLWLLGQADRSIPVPETVSVLEGLREGGRPLAYRVFPGADHGLRDRATGQAVDTWPAVLDWLQELGYR